jgi:hypothetical protein
VLIRFAARSHVALLRACDRLARREGQGTVEYVALVLLVGAVLASVVAIASHKKFGATGIAETIVSKIRAAMDKVK